MKVFYNLQSAHEEIEESVVVLGNFDGVHKGHQLLISNAVSVAKERNLKSLVFTFNELPANVIAGKTLVKSIQKTEEKIKTIAMLSVDYIVCVPFNDFIRYMSPETFADYVLKKNLKCKLAVCGFNYSFGSMGKGNSGTLKTLGMELGFDVKVISELDIDGVLVSSTNLRSFLNDGDVEKYHAFTGRNYSIEGTVIPGQHLGNRMGFPTANLNLDPYMAHPENGVYVTYTYINDKKFNSVTNVGHKPTVGEFAKNAETHIFDFDEDIYGDDLRVEFIKMLRPEQKFSSIDELCKQIAKDCESARAFHNDNA